MASVCLVYSKDAEAWVDYLRSIITENCTFESIEDQQVLNNRHVLEDAEVVIVVFSPDILGTFSREPRLQFINLNAQSRNRIIIFCGLRQQDLDSYDVSRRFDQVESWTKVSVADEEQRNETIRVVKECTNIVRKPTWTQKGMVELPGMTGKAATLGRGRTAPGGWEESEQQKTSTTLPRGMKLDTQLDLHEKEIKPKPFMSNIPRQVSAESTASGRNSPREEKFSPETENKPIVPRKTSKVTQGEPPQIERKPSMEEISSHQDLVKEEKERMTPPQAQRTGDVARRGSGSKPPKMKQQRNRDRETKRASWKATVHPSRIPCGESEALLVFQNELDFQNYEITLFIEGEDPYDRSSVTATYVNPYSYKFTAPEHPPGHVKVSIMKDRTCIGSASYDYCYNLQDYEKVSQFYLRVLDRILETEVCGDRFPVVDRMLQGHMRERELNFEVFKVYEMDFKSETSTEEFPTLLHLTAKYGLQETTAWLSGQEGVQKACSITNQSHDYPVDIAHNHGHSELSAFIDDLVELPEEDYVKMGPDLNSQYDTPFPVAMSIGPDEDSDEFNDGYAHMNRLSFQEQADISGYLRMTGGQPPLPRSESEPALSQSDKAKKSPAPFEPSQSEIYTPLIMEEDLDPSVSEDNPNTPTEKPARKIPGGQEELIEIMNNVKSGEYSQQDAEYMFKDWQMRHKRSSQSVSFKEKKKQMEGLREKLNVKKKKGFFGSRNKKSQPPPPVKEKIFKKSMSQSSMSSIPELQPDVQLRDRSSDESSDGNRDSGFPQEEQETHRTSMGEEDSTPPPEVKRAPPPPARPRKSNLSSHAMFHQDDEIPTEMAPPPPPVLPPRGDRAPP